jgi:hypothetical protein
LFCMVKNTCDFLNMIVYFFIGKTMIFKNTKYIKLSVVVLVTIFMAVFNLSGCRNQSKAIEKDGRASNAQSLDQATEADTAAAMARANIDYAPEYTAVQNKQQPMESDNSSAVAGANIDDAPEYTALHSRLEYSKFQGVIFSNDKISVISLLYRDDEYSQSGELIKTRRLRMDTGYAGVPQYYNSTGQYRTDYSTRIFIPPGPDGELSMEIDTEDVEEIFDYISLPENRTYFFNGDEYYGLQQPFPSPGMLINNGDFKYIFTLAFSYPDESLNVWSISKGTNEPDAIWQGLIDIIEENIISQFE